MTPIPDPEVVGKAHPPIPAPSVVKIHEVAEKIKWDLTPEHRDPEFLAKVNELVDLIVDEETTDWLIEIVRPAMPFGTGWIAAKVLDNLLPGKLRAIIHALLDRLAD